MNIFISYAERNARFAAKIASQVQDFGHQPWLARRHSERNGKWRKEVEKQIQRCDVFIVIMSPPALESEWVEAEIHRAHRLNKPVIPLLWQRKVELPLPLLDLRSISFLTDRAAALDQLQSALDRFRRLAPTLPLSQERKEIFKDIGSTRTAGEPQPGSAPPRYVEALTARPHKEPVLVVVLDFVPVMELFTFEIGADEKVVIGRGQRIRNPCIDVGTMNDLYGTYISRDHAALENRDQCLYITDLGSLNGTSVENQPLVQDSPVQLKSGDRISFGEVLDARVKFRPKSSK